MPPHTTLIEMIHAAPSRLVLAISGGGAASAYDLLRVPGASQTVLEVAVPYATRALDDWLGGPPEQYVSEATARRMAMRAFERARYLALDADVEHLLGIGCTASLATTRLKRGEHRAHLALQSLDRSIAWSVTLCKARRTREEEDRLVSDMVLNVLAETLGLDAPLQLALDPREIWETRSVQAPPEWSDLLLGRRQAVCCVGGEVAANRDPRDVRALFPGSFNPLHAAHQEMVRQAELRLGQTVALELTVCNAEKPPLDYLDLQQRLDGVDPTRPVWLTNLATFDAKSSVFPNVTFVVGADTIRRVGDPAFYGGDPQARLDAIQRLARRGCRFLVFGRRRDREPGAPFETLDDLDLPAPLRAISIGLCESDFRLDVSSTELRRTGQ